MTEPRIQHDGHWYVLESLGPMKKLRRKAVLAELASLGCSRSRAGQLLGLSYPGICAAASRAGVTFGRDVGGQTVPSTRTATMIEMFRTGAALGKIGNHFGVTRERVRQLLKKHAPGIHGGFKLQLQVRNDAAIAAYRDGRTVDDIAEAQGVSDFTVNNVLRSAGLIQTAPRLSDGPEIVALAERVRAGESINSLAAGDRAVQGRLTEYCRRNGIKSKAPSRWLDFSARRKIIAEMIAAGAKWGEIAVAVSQAEGRRVQEHAISTYAARHGLTHEQQVA